MSQLIIIIIMMWAAGRKYMGRERESRSEEVKGGLGVLAEIRGVK